MKNIRPIFFKRGGTPLRQTVAVILIPVMILNEPSVLAAVQTASDTSSQPTVQIPSPVTTPKKVSQNRTLPQFTAATTGFSISSQPTDQEIFSKPLFQEPLVPLGGPTTPAENAALAQALNAFAKRTVRDDASALENFLAANSQSPWRESLLVDMGWLYRQTGWYSKAMDTWQLAWTEGQAIKDLRAKPFVDRALSELIVLNAWVGRMDVLKKLIPVADSRHLTASSKEKVEAAKQALVLMTVKPGTSFRCGPMALEAIRNLKDNNDPTKRLVKTMESTQQGTSMLQLKTLAHKIGLDYQVAKRSPGAEVITPAVVNWKLGHYAALLNKAGDLWHLHDPTFGTDLSVSAQALDSEASGYFLVPSGTLPSGWQKVDDTESATVWGKGSNEGPDGNDNKSGPACGCCPNCGMARFSIFESTTSLSLDDTPLFYQPAFGPAVNFKVSYSQRELQQPSTFTYSNVGPLWTFNWLSYITEVDPGTQVTQYQSGGGTLTYSGYNSTTQSYAPQQQTCGVLKYVNSPTSNPATSNIYELDMPDGSKQIFGLANTMSPDQVFLTRTVDPSGNALTFSYDSSFRMVAVTDATGLVTDITYASTSSSSPGFYQIATVTDPFGRTASLAYTSDGNLASSTDMIGIVSQYNYTAGALQSLHTPYGTTTFDVGQDDAKRWVQINDAQGGQQRVETWNNYNVQVPAADILVAGEDNTYLSYRNSFFWDRKAMLVCNGSLDYSKAQITHWLHEDGNSTMSDQVESTKEPLESRVYYNYFGQPDDSTIITGVNGAPTKISRILKNGDTQQTVLTNNSLGLPTQVKEESIPTGSSTPVVRQTTNYTYDSTNNIDLTQVTQVNGSNNDVLFSATYNSQHEPLTTTDASGQTTTYTYYANGQIETVTNPKGEEAVCAYNSSGQLTSITDQTTSASISFAYDSYGRVRTTTDLNSYTLTYDYDYLNRVTKITYPDGTYDQNTFTNLSLTLQKDRLGRVTQYLYNALEQLTGVVDPQGRVTTYELCTCGALVGLVDALGHRTAWDYDLESRPISKTYADGSQYTYTYDTGFTSRLLSATDPKKQVTHYTYNDDDSLQQVAYADSTIAYTYDGYYPRLTGATKTITATSATYPTSFTYNSVYTSGSPITGGGQLNTETGPLGSTATVTYAYDQLGRNTGTSVNSVGSTISYDSLGRLTGETNPLGAFSYGYYGTTPRLHTISNNQNGLNTSFAYQTGTGSDFRLTDITNYSTGSTVLSKFDYTYNEVGNILTWKQQADSSTPTLWTYGYDKADQLLSATRTNFSTSAVLSQYFYGYDLAGNRTSKQVGLSVVQASFNNLNQTTSASSGGPLQFSGALSKPGSVSVGGKPATMDSSFENFSGAARVSTGTNNVPVVATSVNGYAATNNYQVVVPSGTNISPTHDLDGNLTNNGRGQTYTWDAENQLTSITYASGGSTQFTYDALGRRFEILEWPGAMGTATPTSTKQFVWIRGGLAEERDASNAVTKRFYGQGEQIGGTNYYYTRDHLGSVREMVDNSGAIQARYDYDPYGKVSKISGVLDSDIRYAGYYGHHESGLDLTWFRVYDSISGKWLSRDPLAEQIGPNLYLYADNNPINRVDPAGDQPWVVVILFIAAVSLGVYGLSELVTKTEEGLQPLSQSQQNTADAMSALAKGNSDEAQKDINKVTCNSNKAQDGVNDAAQATADAAKKQAAEDTMPELENPITELIKNIVTDLSVDVATKKPADENADDDDLNPND